MTQTSDEAPSAPGAKDDKISRKIYCEAPNPDYPGRSCTKMVNEDGTHVNGGSEHSDGTYTWGGENS